MIQLETSLGTIKIELNVEKAPISSQNFIDYVQSGHYNGVIFHRVIKKFMIQGGGFTPDMNQAPTQDEIKNEANNGLKNDKYTIAMARTNQPHSASAQFFINCANNDFLNHTAENSQGWGYAVFGQVIEGQDVVDAIEKVQTGRNGHHDDVPLTPVVIIKASVMD